jgi:predicted DNA-binding WGR domain protein
MARFYALSVQADLWAGWSLVREWGRIGGPGRVRIDPHAELTIAETAAQQLGATAADFRDRSDLAVDGGTVTL